MSTGNKRYQRRAFLTMLPAVALAGCSSDDSQPARLREFEITNKKERDVTITVTMSRSGDLRYEQTHELDGQERYTRGSVTISEPWMDTHENIVIKIDTPKETQQFSTQEFAEGMGGELDCRDLNAKIYPGGSVVFSVGTKECELMTPTDS